MASYSEKITLISGNANRELSESIGKHLGIPMANAHVGRFPDQEIDIKVEEDLRGSDCFVIQSTSRRSSTFESLSGPSCSGKWFVVFNATASHGTLSSQRSSSNIPVSSGFAPGPATV